MIENFSDKQKQIIQKASGLVKAARRDDFVKMVEDVLRAQSPPYPHRYRTLPRRLTKIYSPPLAKITFLLRAGPARKPQGHCSGRGGQAEPLRLAAQLPYNFARRLVPSPKATLHGSSWVVCSAAYARGLLALAWREVLDDPHYMERRH